ncbi:DUF4060 family protein [Serratia fonticola]|uniref:DUF4060 family protein n=1 Tax=Serratia fonticola TaxID=47917 RepID=UPI0027EF0078|nr:DUF4060 family protein [Serratia fonticola]MDQ7209069.1 DUF4060 family protein [Serratia fonticola]HBE9082922.1 DUF4060 family protein [Serratia fonticola]HBE9093413.1 DUF4060 family protein [Serratia fonticola]HBE9152355.1 DUF4060 family protein [Serratia fonticola]
MKEVIRGDTEPAHIVAANAAIERHKAKYGEGNKYHPIIYPVKYRSKNYQIEVITRETTIAATVITGVRNLTKLHYGSQQ